MNSPIFDQLRPEICLHLDLGYYNETACFNCRRCPQCQERIRNELWNGHLHETGSLSNTAEAAQARPVGPVSHYLCTSACHNDQPEQCPGNCCVLCPKNWTEWPPPPIPT